jgi:choline-glycine betaine transporter
MPDHPLSRTTTPRLQGLSRLMNWELFAAFFVITAVLIIVPGPIVTLVIATGASQGIRAALTAVAGTTLGTAILLAAIDPTLFVLSHFLRRTGSHFTARCTRISRAPGLSLNRTQAAPQIGRPGGQGTCILFGS